MQRPLACESFRTATVKARLGGQEWLKFLRGHNAFVRAEIQAHGGYGIKTENDRFMVAFGKPAATYDVAAGDSSARPVVRESVSR